MPVHWSDHFQSKALLAIVLVLSACLLGFGLQWHLQLLNGAGALAYNFKAYKNAINLWHIALDSNPNKDLEYARTERYLGSTLNQLRRYAEAKPLLEESLQIRKNMLGNNSATAESMSELALLYLNEGDYHEAETLLKPAMQIAADSLGANNMDTVTYMSNLALCYERQKRFQEAESLFKRCLEITEKVLGEQNVETAFAREQLAEIYVFENKFPEAELHAQKAVAARQHLLGQEDPLTARSMRELAVIYQYEGRYKEAVPLLESALRARDNDILDNIELNTPKTILALAGSYRQIHRYADAEAMYRKALESLKKTRGEGDPDVIECMRGLIYVQAHRPDVQLPAQKTKQLTKDNK